MRPAGGAPPLLPLLAVTKSRHEIRRRQARAVTRRVTIVRADPRPHGAVFANRHGGGRPLFSGRLYVEGFGMFEWETSCVDTLCVAVFR